jgi:hypothetical protein
MRPEGGKGASVFFLACASRQLFDKLCVKTLMTVGDLSGAGFFSKQYF